MANQQPTIPGAPSAPRQKKPYIEPIDPPRLYPQGEPDNPYQSHSGMWHWFNSCAEQDRLRNGEGYLYATQRQSDSAIKIGRSYRPWTRFISFRAEAKNRGDLFRLLWVVKVDEMLESERDAHRRLRPWRIEGEWFDISRENAGRILAVFGEPQFIGVEYEQPRDMPRYRFDD